MHGTMPEWPASAQGYVWAEAEYVWRGVGMADKSVSKTDEGNLVRVRLPLAPLKSTFDCIRRSSILP